MPALVRAYEAAHPGSHVTVTYGASGEVARQVEAGAPIDVVLLAGEGPLERLVQRGRVDTASRRRVASNGLVLVGPRGGKVLTFETLLSLPEGERLAVGDPRTVPAGEYARDYLAALGEWDALQPHLVYGGNVAATLVYARRGEAAAAVVYRTEARGMDDLVVLDVAKGPRAPRPVVVGGSVRGGRAEADEFLRFAASDGARDLLVSFGFDPP
jgi:molybdate transport system substrate-binding protein